MIDELWNLTCVLLLLVLFLLLFSHRKIRSAPVVFLGVIVLLSVYLRSEIYQFAAIRGRDLLDGVYVQDAYRTMDNEIRFVYFKNTHFRASLKFWNGASWGEVKVRRVDPIMRLFLRCQMEAHIGVVRFVNETDASTLWLSTGISREKHRIRVRDVRPPVNFHPNEYKYPHKLGVCLQPVYFHADWTLFAQYFEFWLAAGATKFYIYLHSASRPVKEVLKFYKRKLGKDMERVYLAQVTFSWHLAKKWSEPIGPKLCTAVVWGGISSQAEFGFVISTSSLNNIIPWSDLPVSNLHRGDFHMDPNTRLFRVGIHAAINDCLMRSRYQVKFLSMLDLDETLHVPSGSIVEELDSMDRDFPRLGTLSLQWVYAEHDNENRDIRYPHEVRFDSIGNIRKPIQSRIFSVYRDFRKVIQRPERVVITDIHSALINELLDPVLFELDDKRPINNAKMTDITRVAGEGNVRTSPYRYWEVRVPEERMSVVHLRRFNPAIQGATMQYSNDTTEFRPFTEIARRMNENYSSRMANETLRDYDTGIWQAMMVNTMRTLEECRYYPFNHRQTIGKGACQSIANCEPLISDREHFSKVEQIWTNVAHRGRVFEYVKQ